MDLAGRSSAAELSLCPADSSCAMLISSLLLANVLLRCLAEDCLGAHFQDYVQALQVTESGTPAFGTRQMSFAASCLPHSCTPRESGVPSLSGRRGLDQQAFWGRYAGPVASANACSASLVKFCKKLSSILPLHA